MLRLLDHHGTNWIGLDMPVCGKQVTSRANQAGFGAPFPQRSATSMATVEGGYVRLTQLTRGQRYLAGLVGADAQMHVVAHQGAGVDVQAVSRCTLTQQVQMMAAIVIIQKDGAAIDPALSDVEWYPGDHQASLARHGRTEWSGSPVSVR